MNKKYTLTMLDEQFQHLLNASRQDGSEIAAFLFCSRAETSSELRLLVRDVVVVEPEFVLSRDEGHLTLKSGCYANAFSRGHFEGLSVIFLHSHPGGFPRYSEVDEAHDITMSKSAYDCSPAGPHGSAILIDGEQPYIIARLWQADCKFMRISRVRVVGLQRLHLFDRGPTESETYTNTWAHRQILALGADGQRLLSSLHVGVVGGGGTGSAVCEQLIRLGINFTVMDPDRLELTNVHRVLGSTVQLAEQAIPKVELVAEHRNRIGLPVKVRTIQRTILDEEAARALLDCDIVIGCTDDNLGRSILSRLAMWYYIPVIDIGLAFPSKDGKLLQVLGRMTKVLPGAPCLECHGVVKQGESLAESLFATNRAEYERQRALGYVPELGIPNPSVVPFTMNIATRAITELLELVTGFMNRTEVYCQLNEIYSEPALVQLNQQPKPACWCANKSNWGAGDQDNFLGLHWLTSLIST